MESKFYSIDLNLCGLLLRSALVFKTVMWLSLFVQWFYDEKIYSILFVKKYYYQTCITYQYIYMLHITYKYYDVSIRCQFRFFFWLKINTKHLVAIYFIFLFL